MSTAWGISSPLATGLHRLGLASLVIGTCTINVLSLALPIATLQIYDRVLHGQNFGTARMLIAGVIVALLLETILRVIRSYTISQRGAVYVHGMNCAMLNSLLDAKGVPDKKLNVAQNLSNLSAIKSLKDFENGYAVVVLLELAFLPLFLGVMTYISGSLVLVPVVLLCAFAILTAVSGKRAKARIDRCGENDETRYNFLIECLSSSKFVKSLALEARVQRRFERLHDESCRASYDLSKTLTESFVVATVLGHLMTAATVVAGAYMVINGQLSVGALIAVILLSSRLMQPVQKAVLLWIRFQDYQAAQEKVQLAFANTGTKTWQQPINIANTGHISVKNVSFRPAHNEPLLLDSVDLDIRRGHSVLIDGATGSGKTTLLKLIAGIYCPTSGQVLTNGVDPTKIAPSELMRQVGYLSSRSTIFRGTIRENITRFSNISSAQALEVAEFLNLNQDFARLPLGIDTMVGPDKETAITPGLQQMIAILRVFAAKPRILLYDDADNGLDVRYYNSVFSLLGKIRSQIALIIVSRDYNIRQLAVRSYRLNDGRLHESGSNTFTQIGTRSRFSA